MAKHSFSTNFAGSAQDTTMKAKAAIEKAGGQFNGDDSKGDFSVPTPAGVVKGMYTISGQSFSVTSRCVTGRRSAGPNADTSTFCSAARAAIAGASGSS